jgi:short-subunit dehydrogenase
MKKAIIIGATSGLGKELDKLLAKNDYLVGITGRRTELLNNIEAENPKLYRIKSFDITEIDIIETKLNELTAELGGIDLLIFSSGIGNINTDLDFEIDKKTIETNVFALLPSILKYFKYAQLVAGIVNVVAFWVELIAKQPCVTTLFEPELLIIQTSTILPAV